MLQAAGGASASIDASHHDNAGKQAVATRGAEAQQQERTPSKPPALPRSKSAASPAHGEPEADTLAVPEALRPLWDMFGEQQSPHDFSNCWFEQGSRPLRASIGPAADAVLTAKGLLKRRGERVTYQSLLPVVERSTYKAFQVRPVCIAFVSTCFLPRSRLLCNVGSVGNPSLQSLGTLKLGGTCAGAAFAANQDHVA
jgi:hypothetical protein